uniref:ARAD1A12276p n=1 Tax=Blastobotrys adeninivorans TaxID=409370 RepID=A0A060T3V0_BLAAD
MRLLVALLAAVASAQMVAFPWRTTKGPTRRPHTYDGINRVQDRPAVDDKGEPLFHIQGGKVGPQDVLDKPFQPGTGSDGDYNSEPPAGNSRLLTTKLAVSQEVSIFSSYLREFEGIQARMDDEKQFSVILAPSDTALASLSSKPWEFPYQPVDSSTESQDASARMNIKNFVKHHLHYGEIGSMAILGVEEPESFELSTEAGGTLLVEPNADESLTITAIDDRLGGPTTAKVVRALQADNGVIWVLDHSLLVPENYAPME